jgi:hypothetical protein
MQLFASALELSASDLSQFLSCRHLTAVLAGPQGKMMPCSPAARLRIGAALCTSRSGLAQYATVAVLSEKSLLRRHLHTTTTATLRRKRQMARLRHMFTIPDLDRPRTGCAPNLAVALGRRAATGTDLRFHEEFVWQKQTSKLMLGAGQRPVHRRQFRCSASACAADLMQPGRHPTSPIDPAVRNGRQHRNGTKREGGRNGRSPPLSAHNALR